MINILKTIPEKEKRMTLSTWLTVVRFFLTPFVVLAMVFQMWGVACIVFLLAAFTDFADGMLARLLKEQTLLGAWLDPVADKVLILASFFTLAFIQSPLFHIPLWFVFLVLIKEIILIGGAVWLFYKKGSIDVKPVMLGKLAMLAQTGFIVWLFACYFFKWVPLKTYYTMLALVAVSVCAALVHYMVVGILACKK